MVKYFALCPPPYRYPLRSSHWLTAFSTRNRPALVNRYVQSALENCIGPTSEQLALSAGQKPRN